MFKHAPLSLLITAALTVSSYQSQAETKTDNDFDLWGMCTDSRSVFKQVITLPVIADPEQLDISAQTIRAADQGISFFEDNVLIEKHNFRLSTDKVSYDKNTSTLSLPSPVHIETDRIIFDSQFGEMDNAKDHSVFTDVQFVIQSSHMQGSAPEIKLLGKDTTLLSQVNFSSCEPGKEAWVFSAKDLTLDHLDESGSAHHVVVRVKDVPVFYLPYISFPLGERRRSGILTPELKFSGSRNGDEFSLPYYWNIAPNQDAIITPNYLEKRGLQLATSYRYLTSNSSGELDLEYLDNDRVTDEQRYLSKLVHQTQFNPQLSFHIDASAASDTHYLDDFGESLELSSTSHLQQSAYFQYQQAGWRSKLLSQYFQTIDDSITDASKPYRRKPQLTVNGTEAISDNGLNFSLDAEWVSFEHSLLSKPQGNRTDLHPKFSWPQQGSYWFVRPTIGHRFTSYDLDQPTIEPEDRSLPVAHLDTGLFFERRVAGHYTQTLEPRLYYLYVAHQDQSQLPIFDTSEPDFSFAQLFRDNRFNGADRMADANQLTTALTTRIIDNENGNERFSASIGQIQYYDDREVFLPGGEIETASSSDIAAEFVIRDQHWSYRLSALQNTKSSEIDKGSFLYHYQSDDRHIFNLGYRYRRDEIDANTIDQSDISFKWPVSDHWSVLGRWNYSLTDEHDLESIAGLEYNSCCWAFRVVGRGHLTQDENNEDVFDRSVIFTLVLKGFGSTGKANKELERAILGFHPEY